MSGTKDLMDSNKYHCRSGVKPFGVTTAGGQCALAVDGTESTIGRITSASVSCNLHVTTHGETEEKVK